VIERRQHLGGEQRMAMRQHEHGRAERCALGDAGHEGERDERLQEVGGRRQRKVASGVVGIARSDAPGQHDVVAGPERVVAQRLRAARKPDERLPRRRRTVNGKMAAETHL
jgi:hypothetical protein